MRTFILRARAASTEPKKFLEQKGTDAHIEIIAHSIMNAFFLSGSIRGDVEFFVVLDSTSDFPRTVQFSSNEGVSFPGFDENSILNFISYTLSAAHKSLQKDQTCCTQQGVWVHGYGFERLVTDFLQKQHAVYFLRPKGLPICSEETKLDSPVFVLSDHIPLPEKVMKSFIRRGAKAVSFGKTMLFASQCVTLCHYELDRLESA